MRGRDWDEREHPRDPGDGRFVDKAGGDWADRLSHSLSGAAPAPDPDPEAQARREAVLDALDPHGPTRRAAMSIFEELGLDQSLIREWYNIASPIPSREVNEDDLDQIVAMNLQALADPDDYRAFAMKLIARYPGRFSSSIEMVQDQLAMVDEPPLAPVHIEIDELRSRMSSSPEHAAGDDDQNFAPELRALQFWNEHYGAWQQSDNHHFDPDGRLILMGDGEDAWDDRTMVSGGVMMLPGTLNPYGGRTETVEPGWRPDPEREYYDEEGGYWIPGKYVAVGDGAVFDEDEYEMDDDNEGDFFVGLSSMFFGEQIHWRPKAPRPEGA